MCSLRKISITFLFLCTLFFAHGLSSQVQAASALEIKVGVKQVLKRFKKEVPGGIEFLKKAKGVLIFPEIIKAGLGIGGEYGEGALLIDGKITEYYSTATASIGFQLGAQTKSTLVIFTTEQALKKFRNSDGWKAGVDGSIALVDWGAGKDINTMNVKDPVIGFVFNNKGLMYNLTLEGSKFIKIKKP